MIKTAGQATRYILDTYGCNPRHNAISTMAACREVAKELECTAEECFFFLIENRPIPRQHTTSYGFHTARGREIKELLISRYHKHEDKRRNK